MNVFNNTKHTTIATRAVIADSLKSRLVGLLNRSSLDLGEALILTRCKSIHMLFMKFAIDVIFIDRTNKVVGLVENIKPFQISKTFWHADKAIELPPGIIQASQTQLNDELLIS